LCLLCSQHNSPGNAFLSKKQQSHGYLQCTKDKTDTCQNTFKASKTPFYFLFFIQHTSKNKGSLFAYTGSVNNLLTFMEAFSSVLYSGKIFFRLLKGFSTFLPLPFFLKNIRIAVSYACQEMLWLNWPKL